MQQTKPTERTFYVLGKERSIEEARTVILTSFCSITKKPEPENDLDSYLAVALMLAGHLELLPEAV